MFWAFLVAALAVVIWIDQLAAVLGLTYPRDAARSQDAYAKGIKLLLDNLTPEQREQYRAFGYFDVVGSLTGKQYRIYHGTSRNVNEVIDKNRLGAGRCFMPRGDLVPGDCMLAQKIALENCEDEALRAALRF